MNVNAPVQTFGVMGMARDTYPLASAVCWRKVDIAEALLDHGANPAAGDFAAYREAQTALGENMATRRGTSCRRS